MSLKWQKPKPDVILGYTTRRHLLLDFDNTTRTKIEKIAELLQQQYPKLGNVLILQSSTGTHRERHIYTKHGRVLRVRDLDNFHLVFNNSVGYNTCCKICETLAGLGILNKDYTKIRQFRGDLTLRVSPAILLAGTKPIPYPIIWIKNQYTKRADNYIQHYLRFLSLVRTLSFTRYPTNSTTSNPTDRTDCRN